MRETLKQQTEAATRAATLARVMGRRRRLADELREAGWIVLEPHQRDVSLAIDCGDCGEWMDPAGSYADHNRPIDDNDLMCGWGHYGRRTLENHKGEQVLQLSGTAVLRSRVR